MEKSGNLRIYNPYKPWIGIKKKPYTGQKKTYYTTDNISGACVSGFRDLNRRHLSQTLKKNGVTNASILSNKIIETFIKIYDQQRNYFTFKMFSLSYFFVCLFIFFICYLHII
jgi:hypothetical protein